MMGGVGARCLFNNYFLLFPLVSCKSHTFLPCQRRREEAALASLLLSALPSCCSPWLHRLNGAAGRAAIALLAQVHLKGQGVHFSLPGRCAQYPCVVFLEPSPMACTHTQTFILGMGLHSRQLFHRKLRGEPQHFPFGRFLVISYPQDFCSLFWYKLGVRWHRGQEALGETLRVLDRVRWLPNKTWWGYIALFALFQRDSYSIFRKLCSSNLFRSNRQSPTYPIASYP